MYCVYTEDFKKIIQGRHFTLIKLIVIFKNYIPVELIDGLCDGSDPLSLGVLVWSHEGVGAGLILLLRLGDPVHTEGILV